MWARQNRAVNDTAFTHFDTGRHGGLPAKNLNSGQDTRGLPLCSRYAMAMLSMTYFSSHSESAMKRDRDVCVCNQPTDRPATAIDEPQVPLSFGRHAFQAPPPRSPATFASLALSLRFSASRASSFARSFSLEPGPPALARAGAATAAAR